MGLRILPKLLYGQNHAYRNPFTGSGTEESVTKMTREDLLKFHSTWFKPNNAILVVVGDIKESELKSKLEKNFVSWTSKAVPEKIYKAYRSLPVLQSLLSTSRARCSPSFLRRRWLPLPQNPITQPYRWPTRY